MSPSTGSDTARHGRAGRGRAARQQARPGALPRLGGRELRRQVVDLLRPALRRLRAGPVRRHRARRGAARAALRPRAGAGLRHRLLPAQPDPGRGGPARIGHRPVAGHGEGGHPQRPVIWAWTSTAGSPTPKASRTTTTPSTWWSGTPCCTTSPTSSCRCARWSACSSRVAGSCSPASRPRVGNGYARTLSTLTWRRHHRRDQAARARRLAAAAGRARRELARRGAGGDRRPAHLRPGRPGADGRPTPAPSRSRTATEEFTAAMLGWPVRTFESTVPPGQARLGLGEVRVRQLDDAELGGRQRLAPRGAQGLVLQRHGHRGQAVLSQFDLDDVAYLRSATSERDGAGRRSPAIG